MSADENCEALINGDWHSHRCTRRGKEARAGHQLCTIHASKFDERGYDFAVFWWHWPKVAEAT